MVRTIDRYIIREVVPPFLLSLLILTFLLVLPPVMEHLEKLLAKGVSWSTAARIIWTAVPQAAGLTIPMSLLVGLLVGLGRLSADREAVALLACGVSPYRLLRPVGLMGLVAGAATLYVMLVSIPDANQTFRELTFEVISKRIDSDLHPRVFFQDFPGWVLYARDEPDPGVPGWKDLLVTKTDEASGTRTIYLSRRGRMVINRAERQVHLVLENGNQYSITKDGQADTFNFPGAFVLTLNPDQIFPDINIQRGPNEKTIPELQADMRDKIKNGISPHPEIITIQQKFSIPVACLVFALVGLALGMSVARDGKLAGFVVGIAVIFAYYIVFLLAESLTKGYYANPEAVKHGGRFLIAHFARWAPDVVLALFGAVALARRARYTEGGLSLSVPPGLQRRFAQHQRGDVHGRHRHEMQRRDRDDDQSGPEDEASPLPDGGAEDGDRDRGENARAQHGHRHISGAPGHDPVDAIGRHAGKVHRRDRRTDQGATDDRVDQTVPPGRDAEADPGPDDRDDQRADRQDWIQRHGHARLEGDHGDEMGAPDRRAGTDGCQEQPSDALHAAGDLCASEHLGDREGADAANDHRQHDQPGVVSGYNAQGDIDHNMVREMPSAIVAAPHHNRFGCFPVKIA